MISRRIGSILAAVCAAAFAAAFSTAAATGKPAAAEAAPARGAWGGGALVALEQGLARGAPDREGTISWKGLPYAAPPVGELRWRAPREASPWKGVREARRFGASAPQFFPFFGFVVGSEDCLYLNVWRPDDDEGGLPVYLWIHGGGNSMGSANMVPDYYGHAVAARSRMVFVSINYRLGPFGWFLPPAAPLPAPSSARTEPRSGGRSPWRAEDLPALDACGNYGTLDIIAALAWVRDNIASFGGDPGNVTVAGESAGAMNILSLLTSPYAAGLFHRAVLESGSTRTVSAEAARAASLSLAAKLLARGGKAMNPAQAAESVAAMSPESLWNLLSRATPKAILATTKAGATGMTGWPSIIRDGTVLPADGAKAFARGDYPSKVPILIGSNREETKLFLFFDKSLDWRGDYYAALAKYGSERWRAEGVDELAANLAAAPGQSPVYVYRFDWGAPGPDGRSPLPGTWGRRLGSFHTLEIPFFLGTETINGAFLTGRLFTAANRPGRRDLSGRVMRYIAAFARTGDPNGAVSNAANSAANSAAPGAAPGALPPWPARSPGGAEGLTFGGDERAASILPLDESLTKAEVEARMRRELSEPLLGRVQERLGAQASD